MCFAYSQAMVSVILQYKIQVFGAKSRELLLMFERELEKNPEAGCIHRNLDHTVSNPNLFTYKEEWSSMYSLKEYLNSSRYKFLNGGINVLSKTVERSILELNQLEHTILKNDSTI